MIGETRPLRIVQVNLQHSKAASAAFCNLFLEKKIDVGLVQEPWLFRGKISGLSNTNGRIIFDSTTPNCRACIIVSNRLNCLPLLDLSCRDLSAVKLFWHEGDRRRELILGSVYFPYDDREGPPSRAVRRLVSFAEDNLIKLCLGCDANAHHELWGSSNTNTRGESLLEYILSRSLLVENVGNEFTFSNRRRREVIDITLSTPETTDLIGRWQVLSEPSLSDHRYIYFEIGIQDNTSVSYRNPRKTDWASYLRGIEVGLRDLVVRTRNKSDLKTTADKVSNVIVQAYHSSCPETIKNTCKRNCYWWNEHLAGLRKKLRALFRTSKRNNSWDVYHRALTVYSNAIKKAKKDAWRQYCSEIEEVQVTSRLQKILGKEPMNPIGTIKTSNGQFTSSAQEVLHELLLVHFPGHNQAVPLDNMSSLQVGSGSVSRDTDWVVSKSIVTTEKVKWAVGSFGAFKSPGDDGIFPALLQQGLSHLVPTLCKMYKASIALGFVPSAWCRAKVVFIPKVGKASYSEAKAFRPICLSSFLLKTVEKLVDRYIRDEVLPLRPIHPNQHAYQTGKSCESALHHLVVRVEHALTSKQIALGVFLDIEGAFDNATYASMIGALRNRGVEAAVCNWTEDLLKKRTIIASLFGETREVVATKGCPQGGVLSPLLWTLVVDGLLVELNKDGCYAQGYADDIVILLTGNNLGVVTEGMQRALDATSRWCEAANLRINPQKTFAVPFTRKRNLDDLGPLLLNGINIQLVDEVKYLGIILDRKLTWKSQLARSIKKAKWALMTSRRAFGKSWGLKPKLCWWLYKAVVRPILGYGSLVWWPALAGKTVRCRISSVQRLACLGITGAINSTPTAAMEVLLGLLPLHIFVRAEARKGAFRLKCVGLWSDLTSQVGHSKIIEEISTDPILGMVSDHMSVSYSFHKPFKIWIPEREWWIDGNNHLQEFEIIWFTDGSKTVNGTGAGIHGERPRMDFGVSMGKYSTVFQTEILALSECFCENLHRGYKGKKICIFTDSQAALMALRSCKVESRLVWDCLKLLLDLAVNNTVTLCWVPGHSGLKGNETADIIAKSAADACFLGPEPFCGIAKSSAYLAIKKWAEGKHLAHWRDVPGHRMGKIMLKSPSKSVTAELLSLSRTAIRKVVGAITGHCHLRLHMQRMGVFHGEPICRKCGLEDETADHVIFDCVSLQGKRLNSFGHVSRESGIPAEDLIGGVVDFVNGIDLFG